MLASTGALNKSHSTRAGTQPPLETPTITSGTNPLLRIFPARLKSTLYIRFQVNTSNSVIRVVVLGHRLLHSTSHQIKNYAYIKAGTSSRIESWSLLPFGCPRTYDDEGARVATNTFIQGSEVVCRYKERKFWENNVNPS